MQQHTGLDGFLRNVLIRTLVLWILLFISALVLILALLGISALRHAQQSIASNQMVIQGLNEASLANDQYLRVSSRLLRQQHEVGQGNMDAARTQGEGVRKGIEGAQRHFQNFYNTFSAEPQYRSAIDRIKGIFDTMMTQGLLPQSQALNAGDRDAYWKLLPKYIEHSVAFNREMTAFVTTVQKDQVSMAEGSAIERERTIAFMVAVLVVCLLLAFLTDRYIVAYVRRPLHLLDAHMRRIADGDLTAPIEPYGNNCVGLLVPTLAQMQANLVDTVGTVRQGVDEIYTNAREIAQGNQNLSTRTEQQAASLQQTASSMEEIAATVRQSAEHAAQANQMAADSGLVAERGGQAIEQVVGTMAEISSSSRRIGDIVSVIDSIAFQTNILALNAAVEAARAGEQGRGFAVVAAEVRSLAGRSAAAAKEIKELITASTKTVDEGVHLVDSTKQTMEELFRRAGAVNSLVSEIAAASREQSEGVEQVNQAVGQMDQGTQQNAALVEQSAAAAKSLEAQADHLQRAVSAFRLPGVAGAARRVPPTPLLQG